VRELRDVDLGRTPYWRPIETAIISEFIRPAIVVPSLAMSTKMSPGLPSS
jgi:hypothetical protein